MTHERGGRPLRVERGEQEASAKAAAVRLKLAQDQLDADLRTLLPSPAFQRYLQHLAVKCGTFDLKETLQANVDFREQARRGVGMEINKEVARADARFAAELFSKMLFTVLEPEPTE